LKERCKKNTIQYQKVKFFERVKLERRLKQLLKKDSSTEKEKQTILNDLRYVKFFPPSKRYISLFGKKNTAADEKLMPSLREEALLAASESPEGTDQFLLQFITSKSGPTSTPVSAPEEISPEEDDFFLAN